jgi:para-aminobenzoate synthetase component 1
VLKKHSEKTTFVQAKATMVREEARNMMNRLGTAKVPFLFIIDFDLEQPVVIPLEEINPREILFDVNGTTNSEISTETIPNFSFSFQPVPKERYASAFDLVQKHINHGDSFLLNLTMPSTITTDLALVDIFRFSKAKYRLWFRNEFVVFSPETFVQTRSGKISSFPMKGTMDASLEDAEQKLKTSRKELAEHFTIVDLIRNDLSMIAKNVRVERFQLIERIQTHKHELLQMSSEICGDLPVDYQKSVGDMLFRMLPAGSISGAPKLKTLEVIKQAEQYPRKYYTGIFGIFNGKDIDSGVMIRYIENTADGLVYKSGGGITALSDMDEEYQELIDKIYLPVK